MEEFLTRLFATNAVVLVAIYGQVFFVLGLAVALQWRSESRLELARSVPLLAAFGLTHAFAIWADIFIPQQQGLLPAGNLALLRLLQLLLMLVSFTFLLHFGLKLNWSTPWTPRLPWLLAAIGTLVLVAGYFNDVPSTLLRLRFEQTARPLFLFTGAMLAAWGMRNTAAQVEAMNLPEHIVTWLRMAGFSLGAYALLGGLIVPLSVAEVRITQPSFWGVPVAIPRLLAIGMLAWAMIQALTIFRLELQRAMEEMARLRALATDRQRIGRDLHDGTIQAIYGAGLLLDNGLTFMRDDPDTAETMLRSAIDMLNNTIQDVRRYIFELSDSEGQLAEALGVLVNEMRNQGTAEIEYRIEGNVPRYPTEMRNHLLQIAREAIVNALKHSGGDEIVVALGGEPDALLLTVSDNGRGLPPGGAFRPGGQGVPNLRARTALLGGTIRWISRPGEGLTVEVTVPYEATTAREFEKESQKVSPL
ncbi:MAG: sensor histidine kinase [Chloroflexota bacterium]|nr:sensor histidine kinase [Chloroflexota bacterium]